MARMRGLAANFVIYDEIAGWYNESEAGASDERRAPMTNGSTAVVPMTRRSGGVGAYGIYLEGLKDDGTLLRGFLAAEIVGTSTLAPGAKGARWVLESFPDAEAARNAMTLFFIDVEPQAVTVELTAQDIGRLRRSVITSVIYPLQSLLSEAIDSGWHKVPV